MTKQEKEERRKAIREKLFQLRTQIPTHDRDTASGEPVESHRPNAEEIAKLEAELKKLVEEIEEE
jgi:ribosomal protein L29